jgi:hypothetical protein
LKTPLSHPRGNPGNRGNRGNRRDSRGIRRSIPGLQCDLYGALLALDQPEVERRVRALSAQGLGDAEIARLTGLHVVVVRRVLTGATLNLERGGA